MPRTVILAGGFGTRIRHLLQDLPKPMAPVAGRPFCEWVIRWFQGHGMSDFVLSTGYLSEVVEKHFEARALPGLVLSCVREETPLGTAGGFLNCTAGEAPADGVWIVANGDSIVLADPRPLLALLQREGAQAAVLGLRMEDASRYGTLEVAADGRLLAFKEKRPGKALVNAGIYAFRQEALARMSSKRPLSFETDVFPALIREGAVYVHPVDAPFIDIGTPETLPAATAFILSHQDQFNALSP